MKKQIVLTVLAIALLGATGFAQAGDRGYRNGHDNGYRSARNNRHYAYTNRNYRRQSYRHQSYRHYNRHHDHYKGLKIAAGAVVLGSLIHAISSDRHDRVLVRRTVRSSPAGDFWYRVDSDGQCVEVTLNSQGQEVWTYVDSSYCN